ncbi:hypothetical protein, partial [Thermocrinis sp.]|uniref:hypothetical protein n=1 Tax=Thermocrinis sp. TaxID=2024383 RepID=UPI003C05F0C3
SCLSIMMCSEPTGWDGDANSERKYLLRSLAVPSPPCGMETTKVQPFTLIKVSFRSEPTVWDGDYHGRTPFYGKLTEFRAHRVGWRQVAGHGVPKMPERVRSEPTVWDDDSIPKEKALPKYSIRSKPTAWDEDSEISLIGHMGRW